MRKWLLGAPLAALAAVAATDLRQTRFPILRTFPVLGHARMALTAIGLSADLRRMAGTGFKPIALGLGVWIAVAVSSLAVQFATGQV